MTGRLSSYSICYESLRIYRRTVVQIARARLQQAYSVDWSERVRRPFQRIWDEMVMNADERRLTGEIGSELTDDLDYIGVSQLPSLFESDYDVLFPMPTDSVVDEKALTQRRQAILGWARECRGMRDPIAHDSEADLHYEDAFRLVDSCRRILEHLGPDAEAACERLRDLAQDLSGAAPPTLDEPIERQPLDGYLCSAINGSAFCLT